LSPNFAIRAGLRILDRTVQSENEHQIIATMQSTVMRVSSMMDHVPHFACGRLGARIRIGQRLSNLLGNAGRTERRKVVHADPSPQALLQVS
jgi:hypothetical protein